MAQGQACLAPVLQKKKQRLRKAEYLTQYHTACNWQSQARTQLCEAQCASCMGESGRATGKQQLHRIV